MVVAEGPKVFDVQYIWARILGLLKKFLFLRICGLYFILFLHEIYMEKELTRIFLGAFF